MPFLLSSTCASRPDAGMLQARTDDYREPGVRHRRRGFLNALGMSAEVAAAGRRSPARARVSPPASATTTVLTPGETAGRSIRPQAVQPFPAPT